jgi:LysR family glycine cleavage system transcriptional activator
LKTNNRPLPLTALRAFEAVSRHSHVKQAANELNVTPSAVSHLVKRLEEDLGVKLITKLGRNIKISDAGQQLAPILQETFQTLSKAVNTVRNQANQNTLTISMRPYFSSKWFAPRLNKFWSKNPNVELQLHHSNEVVDFNTQAVDLAIEWSKGDRSDVNHHQLFPGSLIPIFSPNMPGADQIKTPKDLLKYTLLMEIGTNSWSEWFLNAEGSYEKPKLTHYIDDSNVRHQAALDGQGIELSCRELIHHEIENGQLIAPFDTSVDAYSYYLVEPKHRHISNLAQQVKTWIIQEAMTQE